MAVLTPRKVGQNVGRYIPESECPLALLSGKGVGESYGVWGISVSKIQSLLPQSSFLPPNTHRSHCLLYGPSSLTQYLRPFSPSPRPGPWRCFMTIRAVSGPFSGPSSSLVLLLGTQTHFSYTKHPVGSAAFFRPLPAVLSPFYLLNVFLDLSLCSLLP